MLATKNEAAAPLFDRPRVKFKNSPVCHWYTPVLGTKYNYSGSKTWMSKRKKRRAANEPPPNLSSELNVAIAEIVKSADLSNLSMKAVRKQVDAKFSVDLKSVNADEINKMVMSSPGPLHQSTLHIYEVRKL